jgi:2'-5' RNA ligase
MRLFFAVTPPDHVRAKIAHWQQLWSKSVHNVKWVKEENLHLTLKFLGEVVPTQLDQVVSAARSALVGHPAFALVVRRHWRFPASTARPCALAGSKRRCGTTGSITAISRQKSEQPGLSLRKQAFCTPFDPWPSSSTVRGSTAGFSSRKPGSTGEPHHFVREYS